MRATPRPRRPVRRNHRRPRPLLALRRRPHLWWLVVGLLAVTVGWSVSRVVADAEAASQRWRSGRPVLVATRDVSAGDELEASDVALVERPSQLVPEGALSELPADAVLRAAVFDGEIVVRGRIAPTGVRGLAATLPDHTRAVAIPVEPGTAPPLALGDLVDVLVALPPESAGGGPPGFALASDATVVDVGEHAVTVAVERDLAPHIAVALASGAVTLALVGP